MSALDRNALRASLRGRVLWDEALARHTSYGVGGPAEALVLPEDAADLAACLRHCAAQGLPCQVIGDGSNLLVADGGLPGVVIKLAGPGFQGLEPLPDEDPQVLRLRAGAGLPTARLVALARREGIAGLVFLTGIPGSLGGAVHMNAGTTHGDLAGVLSSVDVLLADGSPRRLDVADCGFGYRRSNLPPGAVVVSLELRARRGDPAQVAADIDRYLERRRATQPPGASAGCVFKNPAGEHAGRLIESLGLKGLRVGGAEVSPVHANFIVVQPGTRAADVYALLQRVRATVQERTGLRLEPENLLLGFAAQPEDEP